MNPDDLAKIQEQLNYYQTQANEYANYSNNSEITYDEHLQFIEISQYFMDKYSALNVEAASTVADEIKACAEKIDNINQALDKEIKALQSLEDSIKKGIAIAELAGQLVRLGVKIGSYAA